MVNNNAGKVVSQGMWPMQMGMNRRWEATKKELPLKTNTGKESCRWYRKKVWRCRIILRRTLMTIVFSICASRMTIGRIRMNNSTITNWRAGCLPWRRRLVEYNSNHQSLKKVHSIKLASQPVRWRHSHMLEIRRRHCKAHLHPVMWGYSQMINPLVAAMVARNSSKLWGIVWRQP